MVSIPANYEQRLVDETNTELPSEKTLEVTVDYTSSGSVIRLFRKSEEIMSFHGPYSSPAVRDLEVYLKGYRHALN